MSCPDQESLSAFADGELEAGRVAEVRAHLSTCAACQRFVEEIRELDALGQSSVREIIVTPVSIPKVVPLPVPWLRRVRPLALAAAAVVLAGLFVALWLGPWTRQGSRVVSSPGRSSGKAPLAGRGDSSSKEETFTRWAAPYRQLRIPLVTIEVAASYSPPEIRPALPDTAAH